MAQGRDRDVAVTVKVSQNAVPVQVRLTAMESFEKLRQPRSRCPERRQSTGRVPRWAEDNTLIIWWSHDHWTVANRGLKCFNLWYDLTDCSTLNTELAVLTNMNRMSWIGFIGLCFMSDVFVCAVATNWGVSFTFLRDSRSSFSRFLAKK